MEDSIIILIFDDGFALVIAAPEPEEIPDPDMLTFEIIEGK